MCRVIQRRHLRTSNSPLIDTRVYNRFHNPACDTCYCYSIADLRIAMLLSLCGQYAFAPILTLCSATSFEQTHS